MGKRVLLKMRNKSILSLLVITFFLVMFLSVTSAVAQQITNNDFHDIFPKINANGYTVWTGRDGITLGDNEIFVYDGTSITQITNNTYNDDNAQINDNGLVVWVGKEGSSAEIYLYDITTKTTTQLTNDSLKDEAPQINNNGDITWRKFILSNVNDTAIYLYNGTTQNIIQLANDDFFSGKPQISNSRYVVWEEYDVLGHSVLLLYDIISEVTTEVSSIFNNNGYPSINDSGHVAWHVWEGQNHLDDTGEIFLYDGTTVTQITDNVTADNMAKLNNNDDIIWIGQGSIVNEIFLYDGTSKTITQVSDSILSPYSYEINDNGYIIWDAYDGNDYEIYLYDGSVVSKLTDNVVADSRPHINNAYMVWDGSDGTDWEIFLSAVPSSTTTTTTLPPTTTTTTTTTTLPPVIITTTTTLPPVTTTTTTTLPPTTTTTTTTLPVTTTTPVPATTTNDDNGWCFIATAAYGSSLEPHVMTLRQFRDSYLLTNKLGTKFVETYYKYSPPMADYIAEHDGLRSVTRIGLAPLVGFSWIAMNYGILIALAVLVSMLSLIIGGTCFIVKTGKTK